MKTPARTNRGAPKAAGPEESFQALEASRSDPAWLEPLRKQGMTRFSQTGFPSTEDEEWRFTNVTPIAELPFRPAGETDGKISAKDLEPLLIPGLGGSRLVFVNGIFAAGLSSVSAELKSLGPLSLGDALSDGATGLEAHLGRHADAGANPFVALNNAFFADGACLRIPADLVLAEPIHLLFVAAPGAATHFHPRVLIHLGKHAQASIIEHYATARGGRYFTNAVTEIVLEEGASAEHCKLQTEALDAFHVATVQAKLEKSSRLVSHSVSLGASIARNNIQLVLNGEGVDAVLNGLYLGIGDQLIDHHTVVDHARPRCGSHEFYHGILDGRSKGVFNGKIFVRQDAQKTDAKQTNRGLLLSPDATIDTKPQLEIFADDVKCTHGATVGQLNEEEIFYLRSRGIGLENARKMLVHAFASDVINRITLEPVRADLEKIISLRLDGENGRS